MTAHATETAQILRDMPIDRLTAPTSTTSGEWTYRLFTVDDLGVLPPTWTSLDVASVLDQMNAELIDLLEQRFARCVHTGGDTWTYQLCWGEVLVRTYHYDRGGRTHPPADPVAEILAERMAEADEHQWDDDEADAIRLEILIRYVDEEIYP